MGVTTDQQFQSYKLNSFHVYFKIKCNWNTKSPNKTDALCRIVLVKGYQMGCSDKVSLWYVALLINTRFRFLF